MWAVNPHKDGTQAAQFEAASNPQEKIR